MIRWSTRPDRTLSDRTLCLLRRSLFAATDKALLATRCFLFDLRAAAGICASAALTFSVTIRSVSVSAFAPAWAIPRNMPACVAQQTRAACDDKANHAFQGPRGLYISKSLCSVFGINCHDWRPGVLTTMKCAAFCSSAHGSKTFLKPSTKLQLSRGGHLMPAAHS